MLHVDEPTPTGTLHDDRPPTPSHGVTHRETVGANRETKMPRHPLYVGFAIILGLGALAAPRANADVVYTYTGNDFTFATAPYTTTDRVIASFDLPSVLAPNLVLTTITPSAWSFTDGVQTLTQATSSPLAFEVGT